MIFVTQLWPAGSVCLVLQHTYTRQPYGTEIVFNEMYLRGLSRVNVEVRYSHP
jgi:hypothetical protein